MARLGKYGYAVSDTHQWVTVHPAYLLPKAVERIVALPGVSNDPVTKAAIELILRMELNPNADPLDISEGTDGPQRDSGTLGAREVVNLPGI